MHHAHELIVSAHDAERLVCVVANCDYERQDMHVCDITHNDWCPYDGKLDDVEGLDDGMCSKCRAVQAKEAAYWGALYRREKASGALDPENFCGSCGGALDSEIKCRRCVGEAMLDRADDERKRRREEGPKP